MQAVFLPGLPPPAGHYSPAVVHGGLVFVSGTFPGDPADPGAPRGDIEEQTEQALRNVGRVLEAAGSGLDRLLSVTLYLSDVSLWPRVNAAYARVLGEHRPARTVIPSGELHWGWLVEVQVVAAVR